MESTNTELTPGAKRPRLPHPRFTGLYRGTHYYIGLKWVGPTNLVGKQPFSLVCDAGAPFYQYRGEH